MDDANIVTKNDVVKDEDDAHANEDPNFDENPTSRHLTFISSDDSDLGDGDTIANNAEVKDENDDEKNHDFNKG